MQQYLPIIRPGSIEKKALTRFSGGLNRHTEGETWDDELFPMVELVEPDQLHELEGYHNVSGRLLVDFPRYLSTQSTKFDDLPSLLSKYDNNPVDFFTNNRRYIDIPVVSEAEPEPIEYKEITSIEKELTKDFDSIAVRLFVDGSALSTEQEDNLTNIFELIRETDYVLLDVLQVGGWEGRLYQNIQEIISMAPKTTPIFVLNAFEPREGTGAHNYGPVVTEDLDLNGFGDFVLEPRYPRSGGPAEDVDNIIRYYDQNGFKIENFRDEKYLDAVEPLEDATFFDQDHCPFCSEMADESKRNNGHQFWKRTRMGHYIHAMLEETLGMIENYGPEDLDMDGYETIQQRSESDEDEKETY